MKKIAFISTIECDWGGSEALWSEAAIHLAKTADGVAVEAALPDRVSLAKIGELEKAGCHVHRLPKFRRPRRIFENRKFQWLNQSKPDLVVISLAAHYQGLEWIQECRKRNIPYALIVQSGVECFFHTDNFVEQMRPGYEGAESCFFVSQGNIDFVRTQFASPLVNAQVVRNPFNVSYDAAPPWPVSEKSGDDELMHLACVGRLEPLAKGQDILLEVLKAEKWRSRPLKVTFFGNGLSRRSLIALKDMYGLKNVDFGGFTSNVEDIWAQCHALVLPSRFEGLPLALVEAMLCARTPIVTDVAGNAELVEDNVTGFIAAAPKVAFLDEAMERAWQRRQEWRQIGHLAAQRVREAVPRDPAAVLSKSLLNLLTNS